MPLVLEAIAVFLAFIALEAVVCAALRLRRYGLRDTAANLAMAVGGLVAGIPGRALAVSASYALYAHRIFEIPNVWWAWALLVVAEDACYYCFHRVSHRLPLFWAAHVSHHTSTKFNLSTALRASWTTPFTGIPFWLPLALLGFHPLWIVAVHGVSLAYQFFLHTECVGRLGPLEWVLNTPSHHRVHHACQRQYIDRNFGGIFILWDRLGGTFAEERQRPRYGTVRPLRSHHPFVIAFHGWLALGRALIRPGLLWWERLRVLVRR